MDTTTTRRGFLGRLAAGLAAMTAAPQLLDALKPGRTVTPLPAPSAAFGPSLDVRHHMGPHTVSFAWEANCPVDVYVTRDDGALEESWVALPSQGNVLVVSRPAFGERGRTVQFTATKDRQTVCDQRHVLNKVDARPSFVAGEDLYAGDFVAIGGDGRVVNALRGVALSSSWRTDWGRVR